MCDIAGKDFNIKPLLAKVSKEVNICVGRIKSSNSKLTNADRMVEIFDNVKP